MTHVPKVGSDFRLRKSGPVFDPCIITLTLPKNDGTNIDARTLQDP